MMNIKNVIQDVGTQTNYNGANTCAFIDVSLDCLLYQINCFYCDQIFTLVNWKDFVQHTKDEHCFEERYFAENLAVTADNSTNIIKLEVPFNYDESTDIDSTAFEEVEHFRIKNEAIEDSYIVTTLHDLEEHTNETYEYYSAGADYESSCQLKATGPEVINALNNFKIPWNKLPSRILHYFEQKKPLEGLLSKFSNFIVDELRYISEYIPMGTFRTIAEEVITKYPASFAERDVDGNIFSQGHVQLITKFRNRNNFLNAERRLSSKGDTTKAKSYTIFQSSCINWEPVRSAEEIQEMELKKQALLLLHVQSDFKAHQQNVLSQMKETFALQRIFINKIFWKDAAIKHIMTEWPFLFEVACLQQHFDELMSLDSSCFLTNYLNAKNKLKLYLQSFKLLQAQDNTSDEHIFKSIATYFNEDISLLYQKFEFNTSSENIIENLRVKTPYMAIVPNANDEKIRIYIFVDSILVMTLNEDSLRFVQLLSMLIQMFYVLNIRYPKDISQTLEFCVKFFYKYYCDVTRGSKRNISNIHKVNSLCTRISKFKLDANEAPTNTNKVQNKKTVTETVVAGVDAYEGNFKSEEIIVKEKHLKHNENANSLQNTEKPTTSRLSTVDLAKKTTKRTISSRKHLHQTPSVIYDQIGTTIRNTQALFHSFRIPWHKLSRSILDCCHKRQPLKNLSAFTVIIVDELRLISRHIPLNTFRAVAKQAIDEYPDTFTDRDHEGNIFAGSNLTLITKLRNRNNFLNREKSKNRTIDVRFMHPISVGRQLDVFRKSCSNWQPTDADNLDEVVFNELQAKKAQLLEWHKQATLDDAQKQMILNYMKQTFPLQRLQINKLYGSCTSIQDIQKEWPYLFDEEFLSQHFDELMSIDSICIEANYFASKHLIIAYMMSLKSAASQGDYTSDVDVFNGIAAYFGEDLSLLYKIYQCGTSLEQIDEHLTVTTPFMAVVPDENAQFGTVYTFVNNFMVMTWKYNNFSCLKLVSLLVKLFYVLNILFPKDISQTLEFFVRFFCKYYCDTSRGSKKGINCIQKVNSLIKRISNYGNQNDAKDQNISKTAASTISNLQLYKDDKDNALISSSSEKTQNTNARMQTFDEFNESSLTSTSYQNNPQVLLENYKIPWHKLPRDILERLQKKQKLERRLKYFLEYIVDELRLISKHIPLSVFRLIAKQATEAYPATFLQYDSAGHIISYQNLDLITKLQNRNKLLNRLPQFTDNNEPTLNNMPLFCQRQLDILRKSTSNWQPEETINEATTNEMQIKRDCLLEFHKSGINAKNRQIISTYMKETFTLQRIFINQLFTSNNMPIQRILNEWPFLFHAEYLNQHFDRLMAIESECFERNFIKSKQKVVTFLKTLKNRKDFADDEEILNGIAAYFGEDLTLLYKKYERETSLECIVENLTISSPFFALIKDTNEETASIYIFVEKILVMTIHDKDFTFIHLISLLIQLFYVLNIFYPKDVSQTLEFCVKFFYKYICDVPRGLKRNISNLQKVNTLTKRIVNIKTDDMESEDSRLSSEKEQCGFEAPVEDIEQVAVLNESIKSETLEEFIFTIETVQTENEQNSAKRKTPPIQNSKHKKPSDVGKQFRNFRIPWEKLPSSLLHCLSTKMPLSSQHISHFAAIVIDELRYISAHIPTSVYRAIVEEAVHKYPMSFQDYQSKGKAKLIAKLRNRNHHLNNSSRTNDDEEDNSILPAKRRRNLSNEASLISFEISEANLSECDDRPSTSCTQQTPPSSFDNFQIPWQKLPSQILHCCYKNEKLDRYLSNEFISFIIDELRFISKHIPLNVFRAVIKQATEKYPATFLEHDSEGHIISAQNLSLIAKLRNRNNFLNRAKSTNSSSNVVNTTSTAAGAENTLNDAAAEMPVGMLHKKRLLNFSKICPNWEPAVSLEESAKTMNDLKLQLIKLHQQNASFEANKQLILPLMKQTFPLQRIFINNTLTDHTKIMKLMKEWPFLFNETCLNQHFEELMCFDSNAFEVNYVAAKQKISAFLRTLKHQHSQSDYTNDEEILAAIASYFSEDISLLYQKYERDTKLDNILPNLETTKPFLIVIQNNKSDNFNIFIIVGKVVVITLEDVEFNFISLVSLLIKLYYVLNIWYPKDITQTLEFCVKFFYKNCCDIPRGLKKNMNSIQKVNALIKRISNTRTSEPNSDC